MTCESILEMSANQKERLDSFREAFEAFVKDPQIGGTIDRFYGRPETYRGLYVSGEGGNIVQECKPDPTNPKLFDGKRSAFNRAFLDYGGDDIAQSMRVFLAKHHCEYEWYDGGTVFLFLTPLDSVTDYLDCMEHHTIGSDNSQ